MAEDPAAGNLKIWPVAALYAGLVLNATVLESAGYSYQLVGNLPRLALLLLAYGVFLGLAVFYVPARLGADKGPPLEDLVRSCLGRPGAWLFGRIVLPAWILAWLYFNTSVALWMIEVSILREHIEPVRPWRLALIGLLWLILIAPAAKATLDQLARFSVFTTKVSILLVLGLALSSRATVLDAIADYADLKWDSTMPLEANVLLWIAPALLLAGRVTNGRKCDHRAIVSVIAFGIVLPVVFTVLSAILTLAGAEGIGGMHPMKLPSYLGYAGKRAFDIGWVKILLMTFTLLAATRFAVSLGIGVVTRKRSLWIAAALTTAIIVASWLNRLEFLSVVQDWMFHAWQYTAIPFVPLAGVLCAAYLRARGSEFAFTPAQQRLSLLAWALGCAITVVPTWTKEYTDASGILPAWVVLGWLVSFGATWLLTAGYDRLAGRVTPGAAVEPSV